jgi:hypothetical protein
MSSCSVFISCFNNAQTLAQCLDSILIQGDAKLFLVNDGSTDSSFEILQFYASAHADRICLTQSPHNRGFAFHFLEFSRKLKTPYWAWIGADDIWEAGYLKSQISVLEKSPDALAVFSSYRLISERGQKLDANIADAFDHSFLSTASREQIFSRLISENFLCAPASVCRATPDQSKLVGLLNDKLQDHELWLRLALKGTLLFNPAAQMQYRVLPRSLSKLSQRVALGKLNLYSTLTRVLSSEDLYDFVNQSPQPEELLADIDSSLERASQHASPIQLLRVLYLETLASVLEETPLRQLVLTQLAKTCTKLGLWQKARQLMPAIEKPVISFDSSSSEPSDFIAMNVNDIDRLSLQKTDVLWLEEEELERIRQPNNSEIFNILENSNPPILSQLDNTSSPQLKNGVILFVPNHFVGLVRRLVSSRGFSNAFKWLYSRFKPRSYRSPQ